MQEARQGWEKFFDEEKTSLKKRVLAIYKELSYHFITG